MLDLPSKIRGHRFCFPVKPPVGTWSTVRYVPTRLKKREPSSGRYSSMSWMFLNSLLCRAFPFDHGVFYIRLSWQLTTITEYRHVVDCVWSAHGVECRSHLPKDLVRHCHRWQHDTLLSLEKNFSGASEGRGSCSDDHRHQKFDSHTRLMPSPMNIKNPPFE